MSQKAVEAVLGRMITDVDFRARFFARPAEACRENDCVLSARETDALRSIDLGALRAVSVVLDPKIVRAASLAVPRQARDDDTTKSMHSYSASGTGASRR